MSWSQVSENRWERPSNSVESFYTLIGDVSGSLFEGRRQYMIFSRLNVDLQIPAAEVEDALRYAWKQVRHEQPQIAQTAGEGFKKVYEVPDEDALQLWLDRTFIVSDAEDGDTLANDAPPIQQATFYYVPKASQLVIRAHHSVIDGVGMTLLWHTYLTALMNPNPKLVFGEEAIRLSPSLEQAKGYSDVLPADAVAKGSQTATDALPFYPGIGPVSKVGTVPPGPTQMREYRFSERTTEAIIQACKKGGFTVTAAVHAAFALTVAKHADSTLITDKSKYLTFFQLTLRPYLPEPYNSSEYAVALYYTTWPLVLEIPNDFQQLVQVIGDKYKSACKGLVENMALSNSVQSTILQFAMNPDFLTLPPARDAVFSSVGIIERYLKQSYASADNDRRVIVEDFKMGLEVVMSQPLCTFYTFRNQMRMIYSFNESYDDEALVQTYLEDVENTLVENLLA
ncbi:hypothetical protein N7504_003942 [Penicillium tannophilum]|nr:hypothetical protein N7504_003942 [Penicillium tannophilum]